ncbi:hypothetical protein BH11MYX2_BH11MYX2_06870 [soil metagenome]
MEARTTLVVAMSFVLATACDDGGGSDGPGSGQITDCTSGSACGAAGETCVANGMRCGCAEHGSFLVCESVACPQDPVAPGDPCTMPGTICDPDFEFAGYRCTAPERVFAECLGGTADSRCPSTAPEEGGPCCWNVSGLDPCVYGGDAAMWSCDSDHWLRTP